MCYSLPLLGIKTFQKLIRILIFRMNRFLTIYILQLSEKIIGIIKKVVSQYNLSLNKTNLGNYINK